MNFELGGSGGWGLVFIIGEGGDACPWTARVMTSSLSKLRESLVIPFYKLRALVPLLTDVLWASYAAGRSKYTLGTLLTPSQMTGCLAS